MIATRTESAWNPYQPRHSMIGQGATQTSSSPPAPGQPPSTQLVGDAVISALACAPFDSILSPSLPAASSSTPTTDHRRPSAKAPHPSEVLKCPRCDSLDTKFCYYNNYSLTQPRYFCKNCKRYWTAGGALRNVPVGGGLRKNKRSKLKLAAAAAADAEAALAAQVLAGSVGANPQTQAKCVGEAPLHIENRTVSASANVATPSHVVVGVPELGMYAHSGGFNSSAKPHVDSGLSNPAASQYMSEHMVDQNEAVACTSATTLHPQVGNFYVKNEANEGTAYFCDTAHVPQFYSSYAGSLPIQFAGNAAVSTGTVPGYAINYNFFQADPSGCASNEDVHSGSFSASIAGQSSGGNVKQEKDADGSGNAYDWQIMSEGIFNGTGAPDSSFLYGSSSSWPDFSQFNDNGPGLFDGICAEQQGHFIYTGRFDKSIA